jgi:L-2-hydroxyglutarate oxidase LhgO
MSLGNFDFVVVGGGIIGLATAMALGRENPNRTVAVLEKESEVAQHQTGHNSGVIHAGIYYPPGSKKADFCWTGSTMLRRFCDERGIRYDMCGKLIVATDESELPRLQELFRRGSANGVQGLKMVDAEGLRELEPHAAGIAAVHSPNTGIIDYMDVSRALVGEVEGAGGQVHTGAEVLRISERDGRVVVETGKGEATAKSLVNCAGLHADSVARAMGLDIDVRIFPFRGEYFTLQPDSAGLVNGLLYPVPDPKMPFLGVHFTKRITGGVEAGPSAVLALAREGYSKTDIDLREMLGVLRFPGFWRMAREHWSVGIKEQYRSLAKGVFLRSLQTLVPDIRMEDLSAPGAGVRAQAVDRKGKLLQDFSIVRTRSSVHVLNAPSPGATSCLAIGNHIAGLVAEGA